MKYLKIFTTCVLLISCSVFASTNQPLTEQTESHKLHANMHMFKLKYVNAEKILPLIKPILPKDASISGLQHHIIVQAPEEVLIQIKQLIDKLDITLKQIKILLIQTNEDLSRVYRLSACVNMKSANFNSQLNCINNETGGTWLISNHRRKNQLKTSITVLDGHIGYITTGKEFPYLAAISDIQDDKQLAGVKYKAVLNGIYVKPQIHQDTAILEVAANKSSLSHEQGGEINFHGINTTLEVPYNVWFELGGSSDHTHSSGYETLGTTKDRNNAHSHVWLKVMLDTN